MSVANPTTFLDLCQRLASEVGVSGSGPAAVTAQTGEAARLVNWIASAWLDIQRLHTDWSFLLVSPGVSFATVAGQTLYTPTETGITAGVLGQWKRDTFRCYRTADGTSTEIFLPYLPYDQWRDLYQYGSLRTTNVQPTVMTIAPSFAIGLQTPLAGYTVTGDYYTAPVTMTADADVPSIPTQYIMAIVYRAMMDYGAFESAPEVYQRGDQKFTVLRAAMERSRLPEILTVGALA